MIKWNSERVGRLRHPITVLTPLTTVSERGEATLDWSELRTTRASIQPMVNTEGYISDRNTMTTSMIFVIRKRADYHPAQIILHRGKQYDIESIREVENEYTISGMYLEVRANDRNVPVQLTATTPPAGDLADLLVLGFVQVADSQSGTTWTITKGTLPDPNVVSADEINARCKLYRAGVRIFYPEQYSISGNTIVGISPRLRSEPLHYIQYNEHG